MSAGEVEAFQRLHRQQLIVPEGNLQPVRPRRGEGDDFTDWKLPLGQHRQQFPPHIAGGADDRDIKGHFHLVLVETMLILLLP